MRVLYVPGTLTVFLNGNQILSVPYSFTSGGTHIDTLAPVGGLNLINGSAAYVGFTASSGAVLENHDVLSWTWASSSLGSNYCTANPNSTGAFARVSAGGSASVAANNMTLRCDQMPTSSFAFFLTSRTQGFIANPGGSQGNLCLGGGIGRYVGPGQIQNSGTQGQVALGLNLTQTPQPTGTASIAAGETWYFTAWYRDVVGGSATSNFGNGLEVTFTN